MTTEGKYAPPKSFVADRDALPQRWSHVAIALASGILFLTLAVATLIYLLNSDLNNVQWGRVALLIVVPSLFSAAGIIPFQRISTWGAAIVGALMSIIALVGLAFLAMEVDSALNLHWF